MAKEKLEIRTKNFFTAPNAALRREQHNTTATALRLKHKTYRKPKLPRVVNRS
ncbi:hypothetical protein M634_11215 [Vibrio parahaemolyticus O1:Kuk str. FDA_R31]|nr:hypothetical protein M634_11215 [Vibrio parahaemolyticus O1:Kuk str. FDA_R31]